MPNHLHAFMDLHKDTKSTNTIISNGKRIMVYEIVKRIQGNSLEQLGDKLKVAENESDWNSKESRNILSG